MALFNPKNTKIGKPVKKAFMGCDVYIRGGLNALQSMRLHHEVQALDTKAEDFNVRYDCALVKHYVADAKGEPLYAETIDQMAEDHDSRTISKLCRVVLETIGHPLTDSEAEKN